MPWSWTTDTTSTVKDLDQYLETDLYKKVRPTTERQLSSCEKAAIAVRSKINTSKLDV